MATLQNIRSKGPLLVGAIALALFAFIAGDALKVFQPRQPHDVGEVDGKAISISEYVFLVDAYTNIQKGFSGRNSLSEMETNQIKDMVWNTYVSNQVIANEADKLGLVVTKAELNNILDQGVNPTFRIVPMFFNEQTGRFDKDKLFMFLAEYAKLSKTAGIDPNYMGSMQQLHALWAFVEKSLIQEKLAEKYMALVGSAFGTNKVEVESGIEGRLNQANLTAALIPFTSVDVSKVQVTDADLQKEYDAKKEMFKQDTESRQVKYIDVKINPSVADVEALEQEVSEYAELLRNEKDNYASIINNTSGSNIPYNDVYLSLELYPEDVIAHVKETSVGDTFGPYTNAQDATINAVKVVDKKNLPDSVQFRMLQIQGLEADALVKKSDSIVNALNNGASFKSIAEEEQQPSEAFWISENTIANQEQFVLYNTLSTMQPNEIKSLPVQSGNIILQLVDRKVFKDKYKLAVVKRTMEISSETANKAYNDFSQFVAENSTVQSMIDNAEEAGYSVSTQELTTSMHTVGNISSTKEAVRWIFDSKTGQVSNIYECGEGDHLLVVGLTDIIPAGYRPLSYVKDGLKNLVLNNKKAEYLENQIASVNAKSISDVASIENAVVDTIKHVTFNSPAFISKTNSSEPVVSGYAAVAKEGVLSGPIKGNASVMVLNLLNRDKSEEEVDATVERTRIESEMMYFANGRTILQDLIEKAVIIDNRYLYF